MHATRCNGRVTNNNNNDNKTAGNAAYVGSLDGRIAAADGLTGDVTTATERLFV